MTLTLDTEAIPVDPSRFLGPEGFGWLQQIPLDERKRFVAPPTYYRPLARKVDYTEVDYTEVDHTEVDHTEVDHTKVDDELWWDYHPDEDMRGQRAELLCTLTLFGEGDASDDLLPEVSTVTSAPREAGSQVALEEWLCLNSHCWLLQLPGPGPETPTPELREAAGNVVRRGGCSQLSCFGGDGGWFRSSWRGNSGRISGSISSLNPFDGHRAGSCR